MNLRLMHKAATTRGARVFVRHLTATLGFLLLTCFSPGSLKAAICFCHGERENALCQKKKKTAATRALLLSVLCPSIASESMFRTTAQNACFADCSASAVHKGFEGGSPLSD